MRVVYHKPVHERISLARAMALAEKRKIEKVVLTIAEMDEFKAWLEEITYVDPHFAGFYPRVAGDVRRVCYMGIIVEEEPKPGSVRFL